MRVGFADGQSKVALHAAVELAERHGFDARLYLRSGEAAPGRVGRVETVEAGAARMASYRVATKDLRTGRLDLLLAGCGVALSEFLPVVYAEFSTHRGKDLLFSAAPVRGRGAQKFLLVDPCVVPRPSTGELVTIAERAGPVARALFDQEPYVAMLSYATSGRTSGESEAQLRAIEMLEERGSVPVHPELSQLDAAVNEKVARLKLGRLHRIPNVLICPSLSAANLVYKALEMFGGEQTELSGAILLGLERGLVGLLPRTSDLEQCRNSIEDLIRLRKAMIVPPKRSDEPGPSDDGRDASR